jgi:DNA polymerase III subunit epsilon
MLRLLNNRLARRSFSRRAPAGPLKDYYDVPVPDGRWDWRRADYVALDLETTGLNPRRDEIVSVGWIAIDDEMLDYTRHGHCLVKPTDGVSSESAVIHKIFDTELENAPPIGEVLDQVLPLLAGRILVCHFARVERGFLDAACRRRYGVGFNIPVIDTMELEARKVRAADRSIARGDLRLDAVRQRYNLPRYTAHNALMDAIAAGELFLAQMQHRANRNSIALRDVWSW